MKRKVSIIPPEKLADLKIKPKKKKAAGIPAVMASLEHLKKRARGGQRDEDAE
jgi:hypothetical protein